MEAGSTPIPYFSEMEEIWERGAVGIAGLIRQRTVSSVEVVEAFLRRIEEVNPIINAVVVLTGDRAIDEARAADASLARGQRLGPLHGVPFTAKDVLATAGVETSAGIPERAGVVPSHDAVAVARMRRAGAILLGKTNVPPGGSGGVTENAVHGRTNNPYRSERSPAGSSGGEAAIQGAGGSPVGLGSDSGGSLRVPAHFCGIAALKPTTGRVPTPARSTSPGDWSTLVPRSGRSRATPKTWNRSSRSWQALMVSIAGSFRCPSATREPLNSGGRESRSTRTTDLRRRRGTRPPRSDERQMRWLPPARTSPSLARAHRCGRTRYLAALLGLGRPAGR
jgi:hypothetical protein